MLEPGCAIVRKQPLLYMSLWCTFHRKYMGFKVRKLVFIKVSPFELSHVPLGLSLPFPTFHGFLFLHAFAHTFSYVLQSFEPEAEENINYTLLPSYHFFYLVSFN